ncbi:uncharacterized protein N7529_005921 [Penicillium soppii]|uniref:uncharacterized protein n=1 Tax=Penicillium soppii TaxID=69789 RepID=UPI00254808CA|nr:uncharacterized protein N7529_005921 [Penicillium soppii]KAJ5864005.1 hypothetical protein N7529_005921 [Penicillium soppii]
MTVTGCHQRRLRMGICQYHVRSQQAHGNFHGRDSGQTIATVKAAIEIRELLAGIIKSKSEADSCTLTYGTDISGDYFYGYAYKATTTGENCDTTAERKTILSAIENCATSLHSKGAAVGGCTFHHGGTWHGHLQLSAEPVIYPVHKVTC